MKRRNFLSGLMASPLALKARFARFFVRKRPVELCGAPTIFSTLRQQQLVQLLCEGKSLKETADLLKEAAVVLKVAPLTVELRTEASHPVHCSLPRGHNGPHVLLNPR